MLPNLFIIGAQKSGTTSLHKILGNHPAVFFPRRPQEIHFFDINKNYAKGVHWFESYFAEWHGEKVIAQTSPLYLYEPVVPSRIHALVPHAKFICILRNPVDRAYSHYWHEVCYGYEDLNFEEALDREKERIVQGFDYRRHYSYIDRGRYARQISRFLELFPKEHFLILLYDELRESPESMCIRCEEFLEIERGTISYSRNNGLVYNAAHSPRIKRLQKLTRPLRSSFPLFIHYIDRMNLKGFRYPPMPQTVRVRLLKELKHEIIALEELTQMKLEKWRA